MTFWGGRIGGLWRQRRGNVAVELALVLPMLLLLTMGSVELSLLMMLDGSLEMATAEASRSGSLSGFGTATEREARVKSIVHGLVGQWVPDVSNIAITTFIYPSLVDINSPTWIDANSNGLCDSGEGTCPPSGVQLVPGIGTRGALVVYTITVTRAGFTGIFKLIGVDSYEFKRQAVVLNE